MPAWPPMPRWNLHVTCRTFIGKLLRAGACLGLLAAMPAAAQTSVDSEQLYLIIRTNRLDLPVSDARITKRIGEKLPLFQQNEQFFVALLPSDAENSKLCAFPLQTRDQNRSAWISAERMIIFAYPTYSVEGILSLARGEVFPLVQEARGFYEIIAERFGRQVNLRIPKQLGGIEIVTSAPARIAPGSSLRPIDRTYRGLSAVTNAEGAVVLQFDPAAAAYLDQVMVDSSKVSIRLTDPSITLATGDALPLFQQNDDYFVTLVNTEYDGLRLCAFPLAQAGVRVGWITPEKRLVLADSASSCEGVIYLRQGETLPIMGRNEAEYEVLIERSGRWAPLRIPQTTPDIRLIRARTAAPKPAAPLPPRRTIVLKNEPAINQIVLPIPTDTPEPPPPAVVSQPPAKVQPMVKPPPVLAAATATATATPPAAVYEPPPPDSASAFAAGGSSSTESPAADSNTMASVKEFLAGIWMVLALLAITLVLIILFASISRRKSRKLAAAAPPPPPLYDSATADLIAPPVPTASSDFSGSLASMSIGSVSQFLNSDKESGILSVKDANQMELGTVVFVKGEIVDAKSSTHRGVPAVYDIMRSKEGFFTFVRGDHSTAERTIEDGTITMLLEAHRIMDEEGPKPVAAPKEKPRLRKRPTSHH